MILVEPHYFPSISFFAFALKRQKVCWELFQHHRKGTFRNRCHIVGSQGVQRLSIPLLKGKNSQLPFCEVKIAYFENWQKEHWQSIRTAYGKAPFFQDYSPYLAPLFEQEVEYLAEWNIATTQTIFKLLQIPVDTSKTTKFEAETSPEILDLRDQILPKKSLETFNNYQYSAPQYGQLFVDRLGYIPDLSILDLLFCAGPQSILYLNNALTPQ